MIGTTISHYRISEKLGEGGMGVVYKAEDTKLERTVALKFLAAHLLNDEEAKARFLREARAAAGLHHPNICPVHEIDEAQGRTFLSMAFIEGESLEARIEKGPLPLKEALDIGRQLAEGLEAAHEKGVVHRDIKPANVMVDAKGRATIMDFGLARLTEASRLTRADQTMGTVAYMSPEQAQGVEVDSRSDLWSLGCVVYEMVSGQRPFLGQYDQALLFEIVHEEPAALTGLRTGVPVELELLTSKCLAKDREDRYQSSKEIAVDLRTLGEKLKSGRSTILRTPSMTGPTPALPDNGTRYPTAMVPANSVVMKRSEKRVLQGLAVLLAIAALGFAIAYWKTPEPEKLVRRFAIPFDGLSVGTISPDGRSVAFRVSGTQGGGIWVRELRNEESRRIPGTENVLNECCAWSPDSKFLAFASPEELKRVSVEDGAVTTLCRLPETGGQRFSGATWSPDGQRVAFSSGLNLYEVSSIGGRPNLTLESLGGTQLEVSNPHFLPSDGGPPALLFFSTISGPIPQLAVLNLETGRPQDLGPGEKPVYSPQGYVIYGARASGEQGLWALPFDRTALKPTGEAFPLATEGDTPSVSGDGTLVYRRLPRGGVRGNVVVRDRAGGVLRALKSSVDGFSGDLAVSPDGRRVAVSTDSGIWVYDLDRDTAIRLPKPEGVLSMPRWMNDGALNFVRTGREFMTQAADGSSNAETLYMPPIRTTFFDWSPDRRFFAFTAPDPAGGDGGIWYLERADDGSLSEPRSFLRTSFGENDPQFSPDGRFLAYQSDESGRFEVYVRPFPEAPGKWQLSTNGGYSPRWSPDGNELFYVERAPMATGYALMSVVVSGGSGFASTTPQRLFETEDVRGSMGYSVLTNGRFVMVHGKEGNQASAGQWALGIVENWYEEFRDRERN